MSDLSSNGHSESQSNGVPRIVPPEGQRTARGEFSTAPRDESSLESSNEITVADIPGVEDEYYPPLAPSLAIPPLGIDPDDGPSSDYEKDRYKANRREDTPRDVELGLLAHLNELRQRLLYCAVIVFVGMALTWHFGLTMQEWFARPIRAVLEAKSATGTTGGNELIATDPMGFFSIYFQFSLVSALILTMPLLFWQAWSFIEPALTNSERRYALVLVPFSSVLFFMGAGLGYAVSPLFYKFFIAFQPAGVSAKWDYGQSIVLMAKMLLVFGLSFEVPVIIIFLNKLGILTRNILIEYWRHAVIVIFTVVAVLTPTWDPLTLTICATPPCLLYVLSIWLVKWL